MAINTPTDRIAANTAEQVGGCGAQFVSTGSTVTGKFVAYTVLAGDTDGTTSITSEGSPAGEGIHVPIGTTVYGSMTSIETDDNTELVVYSKCD